MPTLEEIKSQFHKIDDFESFLGEDVGTLSFSFSVLALRRIDEALI